MKWGRSKQTSGIGNHKEGQTGLLDLGYDDDMVLDLGFSSPTEIPIAQLCLTRRHAGSIANFGGKH